MSDRSTCMLFSPPLPPVLLDGATVCIGRHPDCELHLRLDDVSRRHAEIRPDQGRFVIDDLGSTNGTFVNGVRISGPTPLSPGDRIEVGESAVTFCQIGEGAALPGHDLDARTVLFDRTTRPEEADLRGELREIPSAALFQLLEMNRSTGRLDVQTPDGAASVWFEGGQPVHAMSDKHAGFDALLQMVALGEGRFVLSAGEMAPEKTVQASVTEVLMESCRLQDEGARSA